MDHLEPVRRPIQAAPISEPPPPWRRLGDYAVGGLTEVGFAEDSELLLVVSSQGRGVFDCQSGERVARDASPPEESWSYGRGSRALGIGPLAGREIRMSGLCGGGLSRIGRDGWTIESVMLTWPLDNLLLVSPGRSIYDPILSERSNDGSAGFTKLLMQSEVRAFGFSETGNSLVIATSSDLTIYQFRVEE